MIDFHAHLDLYPDPHTTLRQCVADRLYVLSVTTTPSAWPGTSALAKDAPEYRPHSAFIPNSRTSAQVNCRCSQSCCHESATLARSASTGAPSSTGIRNVSSTYSPA